LFSHGQFVCSLAVRWIGLAVIDAPHFSLGTTSLRILGYALGHPERRVVAKWNMAPRTPLPGS
jgi:hypothetical protein